MDFFWTSTRNLLAAEEAAGVRHHVALSVVGLERLPHNGYFLAKIAQEHLIKQSPISYSIVRATQFFEFVTSIADTSSDPDGTTVHLPPALFQPIAADDVVSAVGRIAVGAPLNGTVEIAGPEQFRLDELVRWTLSTYDDPRTVITDHAGRYFGSPLQEHTLVAGPGASLGEMHFEKWLRLSTPPIPMEDPLMVAVEAALHEPPALKENEFRVTEVAAGTCFLVGDAVVFNVDGQFFATQAKCTHRKGPLNEGTLEGSIVTCPWHGAKFNVMTGVVVRGPARDPLKTYRVTVEGEVGRVEAWVLV
jgi:nitrite reductase/ring-hydroxylating ferredoxin subunit